jgi:hypothetical protein
MNRPKLKRDWVGLNVRLLAEVETKGGAIFPIGTIMEVTRNFGGLHLTAVRACKECRLAFRHRVSGVSESKVLIIG